MMFGERGEEACLVPRLRFPEFKQSAGWTLKPLGMLAKRRTTKNAEAKHARVLTNSAEHGVIDQRNYFDKDIANKSNLAGYYVVEQGDFVYNPRISVTAPVGPISKNYIGPGVMSPLYTVFRFNRSENDFYAHFFKSAHWHQYMRDSSSTGARHDRISISIDGFMGMPLPVASVEEEQKIADFFSSLDDLIAAQSQKLESLKSFKNGLVKSLFPSKDEKIPRLRFPEFKNDGEWQPRKVSSLIKRSTKPVKVEADELYQEIGIRSHGKGIFHKEPVRGETLGAKRVFWVEENAFVVNIVFGWEQAVAVTTPAERGMIASHRFPMYIANEDTADVNFVRYFFLTSNGKELLGIASPGGAGRNKTLGQKDFESLEFLCPVNVGEQTKIADCLSSINELIDVQVNQLALLKDQKKGFMEQLFPIMGEVEA
ncbi:restriction endonuclease subunit S [Pseudomonas sp. NMI795_08]|uniref:restriction endonuclease subunit S n=1 Tax=Pseudomonas sp. NMI795_08 TaxID=2903144 RepID=UPI001E4C9373|nr:restriction endonuclease subunit S [Pseudomonas sp. NMI795_08]MCE1115541.1 restriction endonuclease subunit S [Pseudomonas sp. NMI795_08]